MTMKPVSDSKGSELKTHNPGQKIVIWFVKAKEWMKIEGFQGSQHFQIVSSLCNVSETIEAAFSRYRQQSVTWEAVPRKKGRQKEKEGKGEMERERKVEKAFWYCFNWHRYWLKVV